MTHPRSRHPIPEKIVKRARHEHARPDDDIETLEDAHDRLARVQEIGADKLKDWVQEAALGSEKINSWGETKNQYVLVGDLEWRFDNIIFDRAGIDSYSTQQLIKDAHKWLAEDHGVTTADDALVILKPDGWSQGQAQARNVLRNLLAQGLSPAEALDIWFVEYGPHTISQSFQAERRNVSQQAVNNNIGNAREKLYDQQTEHLDL